MSLALRLEQVLRGRLGTYTTFKKIQETVWFVNHVGEVVVVRSVGGHPREENERDLLKRFQDQTSNIRPLIDEIEDPTELDTIVLRHLDDHLPQASIEMTLNGKEIKYVLKAVLKTLSGLNEDSYIYTDTFVNHGDGEDDIRFSDIQRGDFGDAYSQDSKWAKSGTPIDSPIWNNPEVLIDLPYNTTTDIWSFGTLIYGANFNIFRRKEARYDDEIYPFEVELFEDQRFLGD
ncbi:Serine/threonine protein kinase [Pleurostoma richardsiae]|uniref:Serine/threonine protein kinase n=1 Tax=Pleurostoma richardsiae TaxID=41990 RepID=A0AA38VPX2_9PEZI|nr:Serine/threonine protein kinase [Pleurostoma richardsiae]